MRPFCSFAFPAVTLGDGDRRRQTETERPGLLLLSERVHVEGRVHEAPQLHQVGVLVARRRSRGRISAGVPDVLGLLDGGPDARLHVVVVALVLVLLLTPHQVGVGETLELRLHLVERERGELLNAADGHRVLQASPLPLLGQLVVDLAGAEDQPLHRLRALGGGPVVRDQPLEVGSWQHAVKAGAGVRVAQQRLGRENDQRLPEGQQDLPPQNVEVVPRTGAVHHDPVTVVELAHGKVLRDVRHDVRVVVAHLEEPLGPSRRMFWTHSLHAVGQQQNDAVLPDPLGLTRADELVDDALRRVVEVSKLSLPQDQRVGARHGEAQLEAQDAVLGQRAVADGVRRLVRRQVVHGDAGSLVHVLVMENVVTVAEGSSLHVLTRQPDVDPLLQQRTQRHVLGQSPVHRAVPHHLPSALQDATETSVDGEVLHGDGGRHLADLVQVLLRDAGGRAAHGLGLAVQREETGPGRVQPVLDVEDLLVFGAGVRLLADLVVLGDLLLVLLPAHGSLGDQLLRVLLQNRLLLLDLLVHQRLGEHGLVHLVVAHAAVAHQIDHHVLVERGPPLRRHLADVDDGFGVVGVDVEDRRVDDARHVRRVRRGTRHAGVGGEADLVVDHHVHGAVGGVGRQVGQVESLVHDALTREGCVSVHQDGHHPVPLVVSAVELVGFGLALNHGVHGLQVGRVGHQGQRDVPVRHPVDPPVVHPQVVLHVPGALIGSLQPGVELAEDLFQFFTDHVGENVEPTPVRHAHDDVLHAVLRGFIDDGFQGRDQSLASLQAESFLCRPLLLQELLKPGGANHASQQRPLLLQSELHHSWSLELLPDPLTLIQVVDEHELHADVLAVRHLQAADDLLQRQHRLRASYEGGGGQPEHLVQVRLVQAVEAQLVGGCDNVGGDTRVQISVHDAEGVQLGHMVPPDLIGSDEGLDSQVILHQLLHVGLRTDQARRRSQTQRRLVGGARRSAGVGVTEKHVPRLVNTLWVLQPGVVHLLHVVGARPVQERLRGHRCRVAPDWLKRPCAACAGTCDWPLLADSLGRLRGGERTQPRRTSP
uniref:Uncharacterized protein n=1 Tax=Fundulus heteroclitus TaxID=8078 RepID=A0A146YLN3_FUNHE